MFRHGYLALNGMRKTLVRASLYWSGLLKYFQKNATFVCITVSWLLTDTGGAEDAPFLAKYFSFSWGFAENIGLKNLDVLLLPQ